MLRSNGFLIGCSGALHMMYIYKAADIPVGGLHGIKMKPCDASYLASEPVESTDNRKR